MSFEATAIVLAWAAILVLALATAGLLRQVKTVMLLVSGAAPPVAGPVAGQKVPPELLDGTANRDANGTRRRFYIFMDRDCTGCAAITSELAHLGSDSTAQVSLVFRADPIGDIPHTLHVQEGMGATFSQMNIPATPFAVQVAEDGTILQAGPIGSAELLSAFTGTTNGGEPS